MFRIRNSSFWLVFASFVLPSASLILTIYALSFYLLEYYVDRPELIPLAELMNTLPILLGFLFIGLAVDRFHRKRLALISLMLRFLFAACTLISLYYEWLGVALAMLFGRLLFHKLFTTMEMAIIQGIIQEQQYLQVASLKQLINGTLAITGSFIALYIYREFGMIGIMVIDCLFTVIAAILISRARIPIAVCLPNGDRPQLSFRQSLGTIWLDCKHGFRYVWSAPTFRSFLFAFMLFGLVNAILATLPLYSMRFVLTDDVITYQRYTVTFSFLLGLSFMLGSLFFSFLGKTLDARKTVKINLTLLTLLLPALGFIANPVLFYIIVFIIGTIIVVINVTIGAWIPKVVHPAYMGRTYALLDPSSLLTKSLGLLACGWLYPTLVSLHAMYLIFGLALLVGTAIIWRLMRYD